MKLDLDSKLKREEEGEWRGEECTSSHVDKQ